MAKRGEPLFEQIDEVDEFNAGSSFRNRQRAKQLIDFRGFNFKFKGRPTDIDCVNGVGISASIDFDYGGKGFVFYEVKYGLRDMDEGQKAHLIALADHIVTPALVLLVYHTVSDVDKDVMLKDCLVIKGYLNRTGKWFNFNHGETALDATNRFVYKYCPEYLIGDK